MIDFDVTDINFLSDETQRSIAFIAAFQASNILYLLNVKRDVVNEGDYKILLNSCFVKEYKSVLDLYGKNFNNLYTGFNNYFIFFSKNKNDNSQDEINLAEGSSTVFYQLVKLHGRIFKDKKARDMLLNMIENIDTKHSMINPEGKSMQKIISSEFEEIVKYKKGVFTRLALSEIILNAADPDKKDIAYCTAYSAIRAIHIWRQHGGSVFKNLLWPKGRVEPLKLASLIS